VISDKPAVEILVFFVAMDSDDYYTAAVSLAISLVHDGPAPRCLSSCLYTALVNGPDSVTVPLSEMPNSALKEDLELVSSSAGE